ncbi:MAG: TetR family transcriptional regulator [Myxococcota bacterium]|nr:TetR family transcriptional regulator [Myxococcota bacterium]
MPRSASRAAVRAQVDQSGRVLGPKALQTRERLLGATDDLLSKRSLRELRVVDIARKAGTSPATFYQYFRDVEDAVLLLAEQADDEMPALVEQLEAAWSGADRLERARGVVDGFIRHWDSHRAILRVRNLAAEEGDRRFRRTRRKALGPVLEGLAGQIESFQRQGKVGSEIHPQAAAAALAAFLERLASYHSELEGLGIAREDLVDTCARILVQTVTGEA